MSAQSPTTLSNSATNVDEPVNRQSRTVRLQSDQLFHLLANRRRRGVLYYLKEHEETVSMRELAEQIAAWEHGTTVQLLGSGERQRVYISLYQNHLPKLDDNGVIEYDQSRGTIARTDVADQFDPYIQHPPYAEETDEQPKETERPRMNRSSLVRVASLCGVGLGVLTTGWLGVVSTSILLVLTWVVICIAAAVDMAGSAGDRLQDAIVFDE